MEASKINAEPTPNVYVLLKTIGDFMEDVPVQGNQMEEKKEVAERALRLLNDLFYPPVMSKGECKCGGGHPRER